MAESAPPPNRWRPLPPDELFAVMQDAPFPWCLAGGYALERFVGYRYRDHGDIDITVFRADQAELQRHLAGFALFAADPPGRLRPWPTGSRLPAGVHDVWAHRRGRDRWELQVMLQDADEGAWYYRRDRRIHGPRSEFLVDLDGVPCIRPDIQLLYKSKDVRARDQEDFERCLPRLDSGQRESLRRRLATAYPDGHRWLDRVSSLPTG